MTLVAPAPASLLEESAPTPYLAPRMVLSVCPRTLTAFDPFMVSGQVHGSEVEGLDVEVSVVGITRTGRVHDGAWAVRFEQGALPRYHAAGVRPVTARLTDRLLNTAQVTEWVTIEEFVDGHVHVDARTELQESPGTGRHLVATGELGLGCHVDGRELVVVLVTDDTEAVVVATAFVEPSWHHGEWRAQVPLDGVPAGTYRVRAVLTDRACPSLTRTATGDRVHLPPAAHASTPEP